MFGLFAWIFITPIFPFLRSKKLAMIWHNAWSRGMQSHRLFQVWREQGAYPPEEVWLFYDMLRRDIRSASMLWAIALTVGYAFFRVTEHSLADSLVGWGIVFAVWLAMVWLYFKVTVWPATLLWHYGYPETIEMRGVRWLFSKIGWRHALPVQRTEPPHTPAITPANRPAL